MILSTTMMIFHINPLIQKNITYDVEYKRFPKNLNKLNTNYDKVRTQARKEGGITGVPGPPCK